MIRVTPDEAIRMKMLTKKPGLDYVLKETQLDMTYGAGASTHVPDAYERLLHDVLMQNHQSFIHNDELDAAWRLFTPVLQHLESAVDEPNMYPFGIYVDASYFVSIQ